jgi:hypothetical protein
VPSSCVALSIEGSQAEAWKGFGGVGAEKEAVDSDPEHVALGLTFFGEVGRPSFGGNRRRNGAALWSVIGNSDLTVLAQLSCACP